MLRYSQEGLDGRYIALDMDAVHEADGVVWTGNIGIVPGRSVYYYFEVTLMEPVQLELINPAALGAAVLSEDGHSGTVVNEYEITSWTMPDPRNLQLNDRGIFQELFTPDVTAEILTIAVPVISGQVAPADFKVPGKQLQKLQNQLLRNVNKVFIEFEETFDPKLVSVFTVPQVDIETESLWAVNISSIEDGDTRLEAVVRNANADPIDSIVVDFIVDDSAPAATLDIMTADAKTVGYKNRDEVFVTTAHAEGEPAFPVLLNISSKLTDGSLAPDEAFLLYQIIELDADGKPEGTWLPLTVENSMLASDLWDLASAQLRNHPDTAISTAAALPLKQFLGTLSALLNPATIAGAADANPTVQAVLQVLGIQQPTQVQLDLLNELIAAAVADLDVIPLTYDASRPMIPLTDDVSQPISQMFFGAGDFGIRPMGIDTLLNVGSYVPPTRIRVVDPEYDKARVHAVTVGDVNFNGKIDAYEKGVIYRNTLEDVVLTVRVDERTVHPLNRADQHPYASILVQYMDAEGEWQEIGHLELAEGENAPAEGLTIPWKMRAADFDALVGAGSVQVRTVTTNALKLVHTQGSDPDDLTSETFTIKLDADVHPVDPKVLVVDVDDSSIVMTNPDSGAPQGTIQLIGYTPRRTVPATDTIRVEAKRMSDEAWTDIGTVELVDPDGMSGTDTAAIMFNDKALADVYVDDMLHIQDSGRYLKWVITVDTTLLEDTITSENLAAAHAASNPDDNENDVGPLGQNIITVSQDNVEVTP